MFSMNPVSYSLPPKSHVLILVGPTASGKSELAVQLAKRFNGEIISADSRQVYKGMNLGTGKIKGRWTAFHPERAKRVEGSKKNVFVYKNIPHHLIDFLNPRGQYSAALFQRDAKKAITNILKDGKLPILCGGTAHWIDAVVYNLQLPNVQPNAKIRSRLGKHSVDWLYNRLIKLDRHRAHSIDRRNKRRLIRALEIVITTGKPVPQLLTALYSLPTYKALWIGISVPQKILYKKIDKRLYQRINAGMIKEVSRLHLQGISWKRLESFGLEYKFVALYLQKKLTRAEMLTQLSYAIKHYSKRQLTWWKRNKQIKWLKNNKKAFSLTKKFILQTQ